MSAIMRARLVTINAPVRLTVIDAGTAAGAAETFLPVKQISPSFAVMLVT